MWQFIAKVQDMFLSTLGISHRGQLTPGHLLHRHLLTNIYSWEVYSQEIIFKFLEREGFSERGYNLKEGCNRAANNFSKPVGRNSLEKFDLKTFSMVLREMSSFSIGFSAILENSPI